MAARWRIFSALLLCVTTLLAGCDGSNVRTLPPGGLIYSEPDVVYVEGSAITPNVPTSGGGPIRSFSVSPALPAGLSLDAATGIVSGTPTGVSKAALYTVTGANASGSTTARLQIEVRNSAVAPDSLTYTQVSAIYVTGSAIAPNHAVTTGGEVTAFSVSPALPSGLTLNTQTGTITGTPAVAVAQAAYAVTASNSAGSVTTTIDIEVIVPPPVAPTGLSYADPNPVYVVGQPISANLPQGRGGAISHFSVSPALPDGLSIDENSGAISGTAQNVQAAASYVVTGSNTVGSTTATLVITVIPVGAWTPADSMSNPRWYHVSVALEDGRVLVAGGMTSTTSTPGFLASSGLYAADGTWSDAGSMTVAHGLATAARLGNGQVLVAGGANVSGVIEANVDLFNPTTNAWTATASMQTARIESMSASLQDGRVLIVGGLGGTGTTLSSAEIYDPASGQWSSAGTLQQARADAIIAVLPNGKVLVAGGVSQNSATPASIASAEIYDPSTNTWSTTGSLNAARSAATSVVLANGQVLVMGGAAAGGAALASSELYDPATGAWTTMGNLTTARISAVSALLGDGRVLLAGGGSSYGVVTSALSSAEIYDPAGGTWVVATNMSAGRYAATAAALSGGGVIVIGGASGSTLVSSEIFNASARP